MEDDNAREAYLKGQMSQWCVYFDGGVCGHEKWGDMGTEVSSSFCNLCQDRAPGRDYPTKRKQWMGPAPKTCQLCDETLVDKFVDGVINILGQWACMCPDCHSRSGRGLGAGKGQLYTFDPATSCWIKTEG